MNFVRGLNPSAAVAKTDFPCPVGKLLCSDKELHNQHLTSLEYHGKNKIFQRKNWHILMKDRKRHYKKRKNTD